MHCLEVLSRGSEEANARSDEEASNSVLPAASHAYTPDHAGAWVAAHRDLHAAASSFPRVNSRETFFFVIFWQSRRVLVVRLAFLTGDSETVKFRHVRLFSIQWNLFVFFFFLQKTP